MGASIPLPALGIKPVEQPDLLQQFGQIGALKNQQLRGQSEQLQLQQQQMQLSEAQKQKADEDKLTQLYVDNNGDIGKTFMAGAKSGVGLSALNQFQTKAMQAKQAAIQLVQTQGAEALRQADLVKGAHDYLGKLKPEDRAAAYPQVLSGLGQSGLDISQMPQQYPGDEEFNKIGAVINTHTKLVEDAAKEAGINKDNAQATAADAAAANSQAELPGKIAGAQQAQKVNAGTSSTGITADQQAQLANTRRGQDMAHRNDAEGTWSIAEDGKGGYVWTNNKTMEVRPISGGVQPKGTQAKTDAAYEKNVAAPKAAQAYANDYINNGVYTGAGDEALMEKFFELAKPSTGFRMSKPQQDMLLKARNWRNGAEAMFLHATKGTYFTDDQRKEIASTMGSLAAAKLAGSPQPGATDSGSDPFAAFGGKSR